jgi:DNA-binding response OmpR family regulator
MPFTSLIFCDELQALGVLCPELDRAGIERQICTERADAENCLRTRRFETIIVDCDDAAGGRDFMAGVRKVSANRYSMLMAILNGRTNLHQAIEMGANFVLEKPISSDLFARILRAAQGFMLREHRRYFRHTLDTPVEVTRFQQPALHCLARNLSEGGIGIENAQGLKVLDFVIFSFRLPEIEVPIEGKGEIRWITADGRAGLRFVHLDAPGDKQLDAWLSQRFELHAPELFSDTSATGSGPDKP